MTPSHDEVLTRHGVSHARRMILAGQHDDVILAALAAGDRR